MGSRIGGELVATGHEVRWLATGRSDATRARARTESLTAVDDAAALVDGAEVVLSVLPPQAAVDVARLVAATGFAGTYVDANPLSPGTLREVRTAVEAVGATVVDGGVVGPPPRDGGRTHLYLAGPTDAVAQVEAVVAGTRVTPVVLGTRGRSCLGRQAGLRLVQQGPDGAGEPRGGDRRRARCDRRAGRRGRPTGCRAAGRAGGPPGRAGRRGLAVGAGDGRGRPDAAPPPGPTRPRSRASPPSCAGWLRR